ncbi:MAG: tRNA pseudouridine synthase A [Dinghuibacter sp.]|nr:tRNA pseudouridine synthase A [Dinghuibacter sp.]
MAYRYFIEVAYNGLNYSGFQTQPNAPTIQHELERAMQTVLRRPIQLTGSSRTDAEVHARQNFFHFDTEQAIDPIRVYNINAVLPPDITVNSLRPVHAEAHCRFDATSRCYTYRVYSRKDPFLYKRAYFYPYTVSLLQMQAAAAIVRRQTYFEHYSKRHAQVKTYNCTILESAWVQQNGLLVYRVRANRFLRGMVRALAGTMLKVGTGRLDIAAFEASFEAGIAGLVDFSVPGYGLYLEEVSFPENFFEGGKQL